MTCALWGRKCGPKWGCSPKVCLYQERSTPQSLDRTPVEIRMIAARDGAFNARGQGLFGVAISFSSVLGPDITSAHWRELFKGDLPLVPHVLWGTPDDVLYFQVPSFRANTGKPLTFVGPLIFHAWQPIPPVLNSRSGYPHVAFLL